MSFNTSAFLDAKLVPRTEDIKVPDLKPFFDKKDELVWKVRGLTGKELGRANEAVVRNKNIAAILDGLVSSQNSKKTDAVRKLIGNVENDTPEDIAKRLEMLVLGSVEPACDLDLALKLCTAFPVEFFQLTNAITTLTGKGHEPGKAKASGSKTTSGQVQLCVMSGAVFCTRRGLICSLKNS